MHVGGLPYLRSVIVSQDARGQLAADSADRAGLPAPADLVVSLVAAGVLLPLGAVAITAVVTVGGMGLVGEPMNILNNVIVPLLIIIGISDATHLIQRYRDEVRSPTTTQLTERAAGTSHGAVRSRWPACSRLQRRRSASRRSWCRRQ